VDGSLAWEPFAIPGGTEPVSLVRLRSEPDTRAFTVLVRFPSGWERPTGGHYEAAEDVVFLSGTLEINDEVYREGDWAYLPAGFPRRTSRAHTDVLCVARFSGPARWNASVDATPIELASHRRLSDAGEPVEFAFGLGIPLRWGEPDSDWFVPHGLGRDHIAPMDAELVDLDARAYAAVSAGDALPAFRGPVFCRTFEPGS
jgi:hypothetical protein